MNTDNPLLPYVVGVLLIGCVGCFLVWMVSNAGGGAAVPDRFTLLETSTMAADLRIYVARDAVDGRCHAFTYHASLGVVPCSEEAP